MKKHILIGALFALALLASVVRASETVEQTDLADMFQGFDGTFIMYDEGAGRYTVFNKARSEPAFPPAPPSRFSMRSSGWTAAFWIATTPAPS
mgnify:CR=1 FL=1